MCIWYSIFVCERLKYAVTSGMQLIRYLKLYKLKAAGGASNTERRSALDDVLGGVSQRTTVINLCSAFWDNFALYFLENL